MKGTRVTLVFELPTTDDEHTTFLRDVHDPVKLEEAVIELAQFHRPRVRIGRIDIDWKFTPGEKVEFDHGEHEADMGRSPGVFQSQRNNMAFITHETGAGWYPLEDVHKARVMK